MVDIEQLSTHSNLMCIYYHEKNIAVDVIRQIKINLHRHFNYTRIFNNMKDMTAYLASKLVIKRIVFIISIHDEKEATAVEDLAKRRNQFRKLYKIKLEHHTSLILPSLRSMIEKCFNKIIDDLQKTGILPNKESTMEVMENVLDELPPLFNTFKSISTQSMLCDLSKESLKFLLMQSLIEILIRKPYDDKDFEHMLDLCYQDYLENPTEAAKIRKLKQKYKQKNPANWYTQSSCLFRLLNLAFRREDIERIFRFGYYIADLHHQLEQLGSCQRLGKNQNTKTFFRGKRYSVDVIQQFKDNIGHLISLNGLLSTSEDYDISTIFSGLDGKNSDYQSVIFEININCMTKNLIRPYANIREVSANPDENEVLFFMGFVWKLESMEEKWPNLWYIVLQSCADYDSQLIQYIEESRQKCTYLTIGNILHELGDHTSASNFYQRMLKNDILSDENLGHVYFNLALLAEDRGEYLEAQRYLQEAEKLIKTTQTHSNEAFASSRGLFLYDIVPSRMHILNNLGRMYLKDGEYESAQQHFQAALQEPGSEVERAAVLNNYGLLKFQRDNIEQACDYISQAVQLAEDDACCSEFKHNLDMISKHLNLEHAEASAEHVIS
jgi:tetratricopeptide (TPR) repeat protein